MAVRYDDNSEPVSPVPVDDGHCLWQSKICKKPSSSAEATNRERVAVLLKRNWNGGEGHPRGQLNMDP